MSSRLRHVLLAASTALVLAGCNGDENDTGDTSDTQDSDTAQFVGDPVVEVTGGVYLLVGDSMTVTATTINGADSGYAWASSDDALATVTDAGVVTAHRRGEVTITATGSDTAASGSIAIVTEHELPNANAWDGSGHADLTAEAFNHWEGTISPGVCARCHSESGFRDYLGDDGTAEGAIDGSHEDGRVLTCNTCHNTTALSLDHVTFPSGVMLTDLGPEAICMTCHQGRASKDTVDDAITDAGDPGDDEVDTDLGFTNIHYYAAGATLNAGRVRGGYQYDEDPDGEELLYDQRFRHVPGRDTCVGCHDPHSLERRYDACQGCHPGVTNDEAAKDIRMMSSVNTDYDGDGDTTEGIYYELDGLRSKLYTALQTYASETTGTADICYNGAAYPYFFVDDDGSGGFCDAAETTGYATWTPRLLKGAYNYQVSVKDPGAFAHNAKYIFELLHDSITDLNAAIDDEVDMSAAQRTDSGHFDGTAEAFRHWDPSGDESEEVEASCTRCHGGSPGFIFHTTYLANVGLLETPNGLDCATCHPSDWDYDKNDPQVREVAQVDFPSGVVLEADDFAGAADVVCANCHLGRESKKTIDDYLANPPQSGISFRNVHYLPAASTWYGTEVKTGYEYDDETYAGPWNHPPGSSCNYCHSAGATQHTFQVADTFASCTFCHASASSVEEIRLTTFDYDGDGDTSEPLPDELEVFQEVLLDAMWEDTDPTNICYNGSRYPYWFVDANDSGPHCDASEGTRFTGWTETLIKTAHNYQMSVKDPGAWAHNMDYITALLYDSTRTLNGGAYPTWDDDGTERTLNRNPAPTTPPP